MRKPLNPILATLTVRAALPAAGRRGIGARLIGTRFLAPRVGR